MTCPHGTEDSTSRSSGKSRVESREPERTTSEEESVDKGGSYDSVHVFVVDEDRDPLTGQDVVAHLSCAGAPDTVSHQYTDVEGHAVFSCERCSETLHVKFFVQGKSFGPYTIEDQAKYTVKLSRE